MSELSLCLVFCRRSDQPPLKNQCPPSVGGLGVPRTNFCARRTSISLLLGLWLSSVVVKKRKENSRGKAKSRGFCFHFCHGFGLLKHPFPPLTTRNIAYPALTLLARIIAGIKWDTVGYVWKLSCSRTCPAIHS